MRKDRIDGFGAGVLIALSAGLGLNQVLVKLVNGGMEPIFQAGLRSLAAAPLVIGYALLRRQPLSLRDGSFWPGILCGAVFALEFLLLFSGLALTSVTRASIFFYTMPVWLAIAGHFVLGERLTGLRILGLLAGVGAVALALSDQGAAGSSASLWGDILCLSAAICWAAIALLARATKLSKASPVMQLIYQLCVSAPLLLAVSLIPGSFAFAMTPTLWSLFAVQVIGIASVAFLVWFWILSIYPASDMAAFGFLAPLFGVVFGWLILGEALTLSIVASLILVAMALYLINRKG